MIPCSFLSHVLLYTLSSEHSLTLDYLLSFVSIAKNFRFLLLVCRNSSFFGDPYGIRTRVTAVKGRCLNRLTNGPLKKWRRRRDLNPRAAYTTYTLSRGAPSATWVLLHGSTGRTRTYDRSVNSR